MTVMVEDLGMKAEDQAIGELTFPVGNYFDLAKDEFIEMTCEQESTKSKAYGYTLNTNNQTLLTGPCL